MVFRSEKYSISKNWRIFLTVVNDEIWMSFIRFDNDWMRCQYRLTFKMLNSILNLGESWLWLVSLRPKLSCNFITFYFRKRVFFDVWSVRVFFCLNVFRVRFSAWLNSERVYFMILYNVLVFGCVCGRIFKFRVGFLKVMFASIWTRVES